MGCDIDMDPSQSEPFTDQGPHGVGKVRLFLRLFPRNQRRLYAYVLTLLPNRADADDVFQEASLVMWDKFDDAHPQPRDGTIVGCSWVPGRWPGRRALAFKAVTDRVRLDVPGKFDSLTMAAWVRLDGLPNRNNALLMADGWEEGDVHWQIGDDGTIILGVQSSPKGRGAH